VAWVPLYTVRDEHREFAENVDTIRRTADSVGRIPLAELRERICHLYDLLTRKLIPHAMEDDRSSLVETALRLGDRVALLDPVTREHVEIARLLEELDALRWELADPTITALQEQAFRRVLYGLYTILKLHLVGDGECVLDLAAPAEAGGLHGGRLDTEKLASGA